VLGLSVQDPGERDSNEPGDFTDREWYYPDKLCVREKRMDLHLRICDGLIQTKKDRLRLTPETASYDLLSWIRYTTGV
jgi:hypothetical protein